MSREKVEGNVTRKVNLRKAKPTGTCDEVVYIAKHRVDSVPLWESHSSFLTPRILIEKVPISSLEWCSDWVTLSSGSHVSLSSSVQFSRSVVSNSLWPHELQYARPPCPSPTPRVHPNPCPLSQWCHPTISSSVVPFSSLLHSFQHQGFFKWVSSSHQVAKVLEFQL